MEKTRLLAQWTQFNQWPAGRWLFSKLIGLTVPYAASIDARVDVLTEGFARVRLRDRRAVRNHLQSIHAAALAHLAEMTANLALSTLQPRDARWIVMGTQTQLLKKARGTIYAETSLATVDWASPHELVGSVILRDQHRDVVMTATQQWKIGAQTKGSHHA